MIRVEIPSNNLKSVGYDKKNQTLEIKFSTGETYLHFDVPQTVYDELMNAKHKEYYLHYNIRNKYECKRID